MEDRSFNSNHLYEKFNANRLYITFTLSVRHVYFKLLVQKVPTWNHPYKKFNSNGSIWNVYFRPFVRFTSVCLYGATVLQTPNYMMLPFVSEWNETSGQTVKQQIIFIKGLTNMSSVKGSIRLISSFSQTLFLFQHHFNSPQSAVPHQSSCWWWWVYKLIL